MTKNTELGNELGGGPAAPVWLNGVIIKSIITAMDHFISDASASSNRYLHEYFKIYAWLGLMIRDDNNSLIDSVLLIEGKKKLAVKTHVSDMKEMKGY